MDELLSLISWLIVDVLLVSAGRFAVWLVTLGRWRGERIGQNEARVHGPAGALSFTHAEQRVVTRSGLLFAGIAFCIIAAVLLLVVASS